MEKQEASTIELNTNMEELKVDVDENVNELSLEDDILGTQSLMMSESDEDDNDDTKFKDSQSPRKKLLKRSKRILDSDDDNFENVEHPDLANNEDKCAMNKISFSALIDSDCDFNREDLKPLNEDALEASIKEISDTEEKKEIKNTKNKLSLIDSESDDESLTELNDLEFSARKANFEDNLKGKSKLKVMRASAKKAMDEMQTIQSEQQRLHREAHISIPYHKPRKHTLDEFLMRRMIIQPKKCSPVAAAIQKKSLKMTNEELEEYAKLMEERAKEAKEFFKSESENEEYGALKDEKGVLDKPAKITEQNVKNNSSAHKIVVTNNLTENQDNVQLTEDELAALLAEEEQMQQLEDEKPTCSKVLITEVIELPKLDMNIMQKSPLKQCTPRSSLNIKQLVAEKKLSESPCLSGDPNKLIDLETGDLIDKKPSGMENLMKRLVSTFKSRKSKNCETCSILSIENGKLEISKVNINLTEAKDHQNEAKPGAAFFELKRNLKEIIKKKRLEEMNKKQEDEFEYNKCLADDEEDDESEEDESAEIGMEEDEQDDKVKSKFFTVDEEENTMEAKDRLESSVDDHNSEYKPDDDGGDKDDENYNGNDNENYVDVEDDAENGHESNEEDLNDNYNKIEYLDKSQRKNRIIKPFDDTDEEEGENDDIDFLKTQPAATPPSILETQASVKASSENDERELMALCSGTFDETQSSRKALMSQIPVKQKSNIQINDEELMQLCSGTFDQPFASLQTPKPETFKTKCNKILSSDEQSDNNYDKSELNIHKIKKLTKKLKKKAKLGFSDDEDEDRDVVEYVDHKHEEEVDDTNFESDAEEPDTFVDYDSEENEIIVKMTKDEKIKQAQNFFENEAELSESEWGSADEDESHLDKYDIEVGDEDEFDREKLRTELGQIHARKMLDEDIREVRKIQEMLFEDEEKDGVGRQRTFKWKNAENGFSLDDGRLLGDTGDDQNGDSGDEVNEHQWRKIRYEREQFLKEQGLKSDSQDMSSVVSNTIISLNTTGTTAASTKKLQIITSKKIKLSNAVTNKKSPFLISRGISSMHKKSVRGSFLVRDKETLSKLAGLTKGTSSSITVSDMGDTPGTVSVKTIKPKNFVFATLTEEEHERLKRKADDLLNSSIENGKIFFKKPKIEPRRDKCFIDQLL